jgi:NAD(P)-dependent dehydrogenase (short-subunit alcohol dehydrogenase family)
MEPQGGRAVVTGASGKIGEACCRRLLADGYRVVGVDIDAEAGERLAAGLDAGERFAYHAADVRSEAQVEGYVDAAVERMGGIDAFFNNAGVEGRVAPISAYPTDAFDELLSVNLRGVFLGLKYVMPAMQAGGGGAIVNTASIAGLVGVGGLSAYVASKHAVIGLTKVAALEGAPQGIRVTAICPGPIEGRMMSSIEEEAATMLGLPDGSTAHAAFTGMVPAGRYGTAEEVADTVAYLLSPGASYMSGAAIPLDAGWTAQ